MIYRKNGERESFTRIRFVSFLQKAAIILPADEMSPDGQGQAKNRWKLCSVGEVEEAKKVVRIIPMSLTFIVGGIVSSIANTYFIEQASNMNPKLGKWDVPLPLVLLTLLWSKFFVETNNLQLEGASSVVQLRSDDEESDDGLPLGMYFTFIAMVFGILCCITAAKVEEKRLRVVTNHGLLDKPGKDIPFSVFWLYFQFFLLFTHDSLFKTGVTIFFIEKTPASMRDYTGYFGKVVYGLGYICGMLSVYVAGKVSKRGGGESWFQHTLNKSRLDRYYWFLAALASANLVVSMVVARMLYRKNGCRNYFDRVSVCFPDSE